MIDTLFLLDNSKDESLVMGAIIFLEILNNHWVICFKVSNFTSWYKVSIDSLGMNHHKVLIYFTNVHYIRKYMIKGLWISDHNTHMYFCYPWLLLVRLVTRFWSVWLWGDAYSGVWWGWGQGSVAFIVEYLWQAILGTEALSCWNRFGRLRFSEGKLKFYIKQKHSYFNYKLWVPKLASLRKNHIWVW